MEYSYLTPRGHLTIIANTKGDLVSCRFSLIAKNLPLPPARIEKALKNYFLSGASLVSIPRDAMGTAFQKLVWNHICTIPYGHTTSYQDIARAIGRPRAVRAVGSACGNNPLALFIPCHRVVRKDGGMSSYAWGTRRKAWLLSHEQSTQKLRKTKSPRSRAQEGRPKG